MRSLLVATIMAALAGLGGSASAFAQGTDNGPATDPTRNGGNTVVNKGAGSGTGTPEMSRGMTTGTPTADPTENGGNARVNSGAGSGTGTEKPAAGGR